MIITLVGRYMFVFVLDRWCKETQDDFQNNKHEGGKKHNPAIGMIIVLFGGFVCICS